MHLDAWPDGAAMPFLNRVREHGTRHGIDVVQLQGDYALGSGHAAVLSLLRYGADAPVGGVIFGNDLLAMGGLLALREVRVRSPEDIAIVSRDENPAEPLTFAECTTGAALMLPLPWVEALPTVVEPPGRSLRSGT